MKVFLVFSGKAILPEREAYKEFLEFHGFKVEEILYKELLKKNKEELKNSILWYFMGFYPRKLKAKFIIHDYRSLSVGKFARLKDMLKRYFNHKPDLRIFENENVKDFLGFSDDVPYVFINMGLPEDILKYKDEKIEKKTDFIYIGAISREREMDKLIKGFLERYGTSKSFWLVGPYEKAIFDEFHVYNNIKFLGKVEQSEVFELVRSSEYAVSWVPNKYPYKWQTPTKLLEYLALGVKVIVNNNPMQLKILKETGNYSKVYVMRDWKDFPDENVLRGLKNTCVDFAKFAWKSILERSGVLTFLKSML